MKNEEIGLSLVVSLITLNFETQMASNPFNVSKGFMAAKVSAKGIRIARTESGGIVKFTS